MEVLSKITIKGVCGNIDDLAKTLKGPISLCTIIGVVRSFEETHSNYGLSYRFNGDFKAINMLTNEQYFSGSCFLPAIAESLVHGQLDPMGINALQMAFTIGIKPANNKVNYEYTVKPLIQPAENNPLAALEKKISMGIPSMVDTSTKPEKITHINQVEF